MAMGKNVLIPLDIVQRIVELLEYWDVTGYDRVILDDYYCILHELGTRLKKLELREVYAGIINAKNEDARHSARIEYLRLRNQIAYDYAVDLEY
jgi:hypothetical protein